MGIYADILDGHRARLDRRVIFIPLGRGNMASRAHTKQRLDNEWIGCLTYKSMATYNPTPADLKAMVSKARARNRELGITGMLLFEDGCFLQTLEGPPDQLDMVWNSIKRDPRHRDIQVLSEHVVNNRLFSAWDLMLYDREHDHAKRSSHAAAPPAIARSIRKLQRLALEGDDRKIDTLLGQLGEQGWKADAIISLLIEPAARAGRCVAGRSMHRDRSDHCAEHAATCRPCRAQCPARDPAPRFATLQHSAGHGSRGTTPARHQPARRSVH